MKKQQNYRHTSIRTVCVKWRAGVERLKVNNIVARERKRNYIPQRVEQVNVRDRKKKEEIRICVCVLVQK